MHSLLLTCLPAPHLLRRRVYRWSISARSDRASAQRQLRLDPSRLRAAVSYLIDNDADSLSV